MNIKQAKSFFLISLLLPFVEIYSAGDGIRQFNYWIDRENYKNLNLFDFGGNPAWLVNAEKYDYLLFDTHSNNIWGNNKRRFDPDGKHINNLSFSGNTRLSETSTFYGESSYQFDRRSNQNMSLKYNSYSGEAFFTTDTTKGNILYHGPQIGFIYSTQIIPNLVSGIEFNYGLIDGLKSNYSQAQSLLRKIYTRFGLAYSFSEHLVLGADIDYYDTQESINAKGNEQYMVDIYSFRGDTYSVLNRENEFNEKIRKKGAVFGSQIIYKPSNKYEFGLAEEYSEYNLKNEFGDLEIEDGFANFTNYKTKFEFIYNFSENCYLSNSINYLYSQSWSKHSMLNLLLWKWNLSDLSYNAGFTYESNNKNFLFTIDYTADYLNVDSSKYIDRKFREINALNHYFSVDAIYPVYKSLQIHNKIEIYKLNTDPVTGNKNFLAENYILGAGLVLSEKIHAFFDVSYLTNNNFDNNLFQKNFDIQLTLKIFK